MYMSRGRFGAAQARYSSIDVTSRIEGASPHRLVSILFDELLKALDAMSAAQKRGDIGQRGSRQSRALAILSGLETSLDFDKGGEIAKGLAAIYREARRLVIVAADANDPAPIEQAKEMLREIASAWDGIG